MYWNGDGNTLSSTNWDKQEQIAYRNKVARRPIVLIVAASARSGTGVLPKIAPIPRLFDYVGDVLDIVIKLELLLMRRSVVPFDVY